METKSKIEFGFCFQIFWFWSWFYFSLVLVVVLVSVLVFNRFAFGFGFQSFWFRFMNFLQVFCGFSFVYGWGFYHWIGKESHYKQCAVWNLRSNASTTQNREFKKKKKWVKSVSYFALCHVSDP